MPVIGPGPYPTSSDVYHSGNVFVNYVNVALWNDPAGTDAVVLNAILAVINNPEYANETKTQEAVEGETQDEYGVAKEQKKLVESGVIKQEQLNAGAGAGAAPLAADPAAGTASAGSATTATNLDSIIDETILYSYSADNNIRVKNVTKVPGVTFPYDVETVAPQNGVAVQDVCDNLRALVTNCWVPIKAQYPNAFITCSFRKAGVGSPTSQHPKGQAMDIQFAGASKADYYTIAQWIKSNVPYDQLLLEYKTTGTGNPWIHISYDRNSNRGQVCTFMNDKNCKGPGVQGLYDLSNA